MDEQILIYAAILVAVIVLTIVGILSRYRKCKSDEVLVVYGKTGDKKSLSIPHSFTALPIPSIK
jgi:flotillin